MTQKVSEAKKKVAAAEKKVAAAKQEVAAAEKKVEAAEKKVAEAEKKAAAAETKYKEARETGVKDILKDRWKNAEKGVTNAIEGVTNAEKVVGAAVEVLMGASEALSAAYKAQEYGRAFDDDYSAIVDFVRTQKAKSETLTLSISTAKTDRVLEVKNNMGFREDVATWVNKPCFDAPTVNNSHTWLSSKEDSQENRAAYMKYLGDNIILPEDTKLFDATSKPNLLSVRMQHFGVKVTGNIDVVLVASHHMDMDCVQDNILAGIELKKDTNTQRYKSQVTLQHLSASYLNPDTGVLTLMTDLNERWHFFWFVEKPTKLLMQYKATRPEARYLIQHMLDDDDDESVFTPTGFLSRACWNEMFSVLERIPEHIGTAESDESDGSNSDPGTATQPDKQQTGRGNKGSSSLPAGVVQEESNSGQERGKPTTTKSKSVEQHYAQPVDRYLDFMDEEELREATFMMVLETSLNRCEYAPEDQPSRATKRPPSEISFDRSADDEMKGI